MKDETRKSKNLFVEVTQVHHVETSLLLPESSYHELDFCPKRIASYWSSAPSTSLDFASLSNDRAVEDTMNNIIIITDVECVNKSIACSENDNDLQIAECTGAIGNPI